MQWDIKPRLESIIDTLLANRGIVSKGKSSFLNPISPIEIPIEEVELSKSSIEASINLIRQAKQNNIPILVFGDYDTDGITATTILWEALRSFGIERVVPFIPSRDKHGYGLSIAAVKEALSNKLLINANKILIITVDNGIVAHEAVRYLKELNHLIIITDHHTLPTEAVEANVIVHTTKLCGAGIAWMLARELNQDSAINSLDVLAIGTIADMMPLSGYNRSIVYWGLKEITRTSRVGLRALCQEAGIEDTEIITPYHVNYLIAPRLNAMGRMTEALDSLRLLCTTNQDRAKKLATLLGNINRERQDLTAELVETSKLQVLKENDNHVIILSGDNYHEGVIGLVAGKLVEKFYKPTIVISRKEGVSKASARSIKGVNITELIRMQQELLLGLGGHPMAAGFSIETIKIEKFKMAVQEYCNTNIAKELLIPTLVVDCVLRDNELSLETYQLISTLEPFGTGNPNPVFCLMGAQVLMVQTMGRDQKHLKLILKTDVGPIEAVWFGNGAKKEQILNSSVVDIAFNLSLNTWKGKSKLQLMVKDVIV